jgi:ribosomal protein L12E/L44/L45/RPP1/RPP2
MTLDIPLSSEAEKRLRERAAAAGVDVRSCARRLLEEALTKPSLDEVLAPIRQRFAASGVSEEELAEGLERERRLMREERRQRQTP